MFQRLLRLLGIVKPVESVTELDDQTYTDAVMDNAIRTGVDTVETLARATVVAKASHDKLSSELDHMSRNYDPMTGLLADLHHLGKPKDDRNG
jgi:hypothetical protein